MANDIVQWGKNRTNLLPDVREEVLNLLARYAPKKKIIKHIEDKHNITLKHEQINGLSHRYQERLYSIRKNIDKTMLHEIPISSVYWRQKQRYKLLKKELAKKPDDLILKELYFIYNSELAKKRADRDNALLKKTLWQIQQEESKQPDKHFVIKILREAAEETKESKNFNVQVNQFNRLELSAEDYVKHLRIEQGSDEYVNKLRNEVSIPDVDQIEDMEASESGAEDDARLDYDDLDELSDVDMTL